MKIRVPSLIILLGFTAFSVPISAAPPAHDPGLYIDVFNQIADVCISTARGRAPSASTAEKLLLRPLLSEPAILGGQFGKLISWFQSIKNPNSIYIGIGKSDSCNIFIVNTNQTREVQAQLAQLLQLSGFSRIVATGPDSKEFSDISFAKAGPDGYLLVGIQGALETIGDGSGLQAEVHVRLMPKELFDAMRANR